MQRVRAANWPSPGSAAGSDVCSQSVGLTSPCGRAARRIWRFSGTGAPDGGLVPPGTNGGRGPYRDDRRARRAAPSVRSARPQPRPSARPDASRMLASRTLPSPARLALPSRVRALPRPRPELAALLLLAAVLDLWSLSRNGWANEYYAAAVRS